MHAADIGLKNAVERRKRWRLAEKSEKQILRSADMAATIYTY